MTEALPETERVIGIDWGVKETATTTSDGHDLAHPQDGRTAAQKLARYQRMMARRKPKKGQAAYKGYREAKRQTARLHRKVAAQRMGTGRKWAKRVVRDHDAIAVEDFRPKFLAKTTMARNAADAAISATKKAWSRWAASTAGPYTWSTPRTPAWTARSAEREPSTHSLFPNERMPAPRAEPYRPAIRTPPA